MPGNEYFLCDQMEDPVGISVDRCNCSWIIIKLYSGKENRLFDSDRAIIRADYRTGTEGAYATDGCRVSCERIRVRSIMP